MQLIQPDVRPVKESGDLYELREDYSFDFLGETLIVPAGFKYDGASYAALLFQRDGIHRAAALVHDYLYVKEGVIGNFKFTRKQADQKFRELLISAGVKSWHVWLAYHAVRIGGGLYWSDK